MLDINELEYDSWQAVYFQRATVIVTELLLVYALSRQVFALRSPLKGAHVF